MIRTFLVKTIQLTSTTQGANITKITKFFNIKIIFLRILHCKNESNALHSREFVNQLWPIFEELSLNDNIKNFFHARFVFMQNFCFSIPYQGKKDNHTYLAEGRYGRGFDRHGFNNMLYSPDFPVNL